MCEQILRLFFGNVLVIFGVFVGPCFGIVFDKLWVSPGYNFKVKMKSKLELYFIASGRLFGTALGRLIGLLWAFLKGLMAYEHTHISKTEMLIIFAF